MTRQVDSDPHAASKHAWYSWRMHDGATSRESFDEGFLRGAQWMARTSGQLSPHFAQLADLMVWLMQSDGMSSWDEYTEPVLSTTSSGTGEADDPW